MYRISVPYAQKDPRFLFEKRRGQPQEFWSLVHYPRTVWKNSYAAEHEVTGKTYIQLKKLKNDDSGTLIIQNRMRSD